MYRDPRGHYEMAEKGEMPALPGAGVNYDVPNSPDLSLDTDELSVAECVEQVIALLREKKIIR